MVDGPPDEPRDSSEPEREGIESIDPILPDAPVGQSLFESGAEPPAMRKEPTVTVGAIFLSLLILLVWAGITAGLGFFLMLMLAFMSDAGLPDERLQSGALFATMICLVIVGVAGIPFGVGVAAKAIRKPCFVTAGVIAGIGVIGVFVSVLTYTSPFFAEG